MKINTALVDVVFDQLSIAAMTKDPCLLIDSDDTDAVRSLYRRFLVPWYQRLAPTNKDELIQTLLSVAQHDAERVFDRVFSSSPYLPFSDDPKWPRLLLESLIEEFEPCNNARDVLPVEKVYEDRRNANLILEGMAPDEAITEDDRTRANAILKRFFEE